MASLPVAAARGWIDSNPLSGGGENPHTHISTQGVLLAGNLPPLTFPMSCFRGGGLILICDPHIGPKQIK